MEQTKVYPPLTAYRIFYDDGSIEETNMAAGVTLEQARAYFVGQRFCLSDERTFKTATKVEKIA